VIARDRGDLLIENRMDVGFRLPNYSITNFLLFLLSSVFQGFDFFNAPDGPPPAIEPLGPAAAKNR